MAKEVIAPEQEVVVPQESVNEAEVNVNASTFNKIVRELIANGARQFKDVEIKNVNVTELDNYTRVSLTLKSSIPGYISKDGGNTYEKGETNIIFLGLYGIIGQIKENEELAWMANKVLEHPEILNLILCGSKINILQREYEAGEEIKNPFSTKEDSEGNVYDHDVIVNDVIAIKLGKTGLKMAEKLADKMLGF